MPRAVLFDFNGVLVDDEPLHHEAFRRLLGELGETLGRARYVEDFLGRSDRDGLEATFRRRGEIASPARLSHLLERKTAVYRELLRDRGLPWVAGAVELARAVAASGRRLGVVSGALRAEVSEALDAAGIGALFEVLVSAEEVRRGKPDPEGYRLALARLNALEPAPAPRIRPDQVLAIEDSPAGVAAAAAAGLVTAGLVGGAFAAEPGGADIVLLELAGLTMERLAELFAGVS